MTGRTNHDLDPFEPGRRPEGRRWYVVQSQPRRELYAAQNLEHQGFVAFLPRFRKTRRHARRSSTVLAALFPRYLFVALDLGRDRWRSVYATFGVACLLNNGSWPLATPEGLVEDLIAASGRNHIVDLTPALRPGQQVRFLAGPFAEAIGQLTELDDAGRARVLLELLGAAREVTVVSSSLAPAGHGALGATVGG